MATLSNGTVEHDADRPSAGDVDDPSDAADGAAQRGGPAELLLLGHRGELAVLGVAPAEQLALVCLTPWRGIRKKKNHFFKKDTKFPKLRKKKIQKV